MSTNEAAERLREALSNYSQISADGKHWFNPEKELAAALAHERSAGAAPWPRPDLSHWIHHDPDCAWHLSDPKGCDCGLAKVWNGEPVAHERSAGAAPLDARADVQHALDALNAAMDKIRDGDSPESDLLESHATLDFADRPPLRRVFTGWQDAPRLYQCPVCWSTVIDLREAGRSAGAAPLDVDDLGWTLYEMGIDDLSLDDARKLAAHIIVRLAARLSEGTDR